MRIEVSRVTCYRIFDAPKLDPITLILRDDGGSGQVTVECYGQAWSTYFGAIGVAPLLKFIAGINPGYLQDRLQGPKATKKDGAYLLRICEAIVEACKSLTKGES